MKAELYETQLNLLDRVIEEGTYGKSREEVLRTIVLEHARSLLAGGGMFDMVAPTVVEVPKPEYGKMRYEHVLPPVTGVAVPVYQGEVLRIMQVEGGQCVDFNAYNLHDYKETLSNGMSKQASGHRPGKGYIAWSAAPRARPMFVILDMPETCKIWINAHRCTAVYFERTWGFFRHTNCQDTLAEAIRAYGMTPDDVQDSFNLWMNVNLDAKGRTRYEWNPGQKGDYIDFLSLFDTLAVPVICGSSVLTGISNFRFAPIAVQILSASPATREMVKMVNGRWGNYKGQKKSTDFKIKDIRVERELKPLPGYRPDYNPVSGTVSLNINLTPVEKDTLQSLMKTGQYGKTELEAIRACFMRWYNATRLKEYCSSLLIR